jgi:hypothetical protein
MNAPVSVHLELYRYWTSKRGTRRIPSWGDIDPTDIPYLLPYVGMLERANGELRHRLMGSALVQDFEGDFTGKAIGSDRGGVPERLQAMQALAGLIFAMGHPVFVTGEHETKYGSHRNRSALILPLSEDGRYVDKVIFTFIMRFSRGSTPTAYWLSSLSIGVHGIVRVNDVADLETCCFNWERHCHPDFPAQISLEKCSTANWRSLR